MNSNEIFQKLKTPFKESEIEWRAGSTTQDKTRALAMAYIDARAVMNRLDDVVGAENWSDAYQIIEGSDKHARGYICTLSLRINGEWTSKSDGADESDFESTKGGLSDAFKRAANKWGIGRYLYNLEAQWVPCEASGKSVKLKANPKLPAWALPQANDALQEFERVQASQAPKQTAQKPANPDWMLTHADQVAYIKADGTRGDAEDIAKMVAEQEEPMSLEEAYKFETSQGKRYGDMSVKELEYMLNALQKRMHSTKCTEEEMPVIKRKIEAARIIWSAKKDGSIK